MSVRILLADDHKIMREGLRSLLEHEDGMDVVGEAEDGGDAVRQASELKPDVVVMDIGMPNMNGVEAARRIIEHQPATKVIALSMHAGRQFVSSMLEAGASGYVLKDGAFEDLAIAVRTVAQNGKYLCPAIADVVAQNLRDQARTTSELSDLTDRELEVLKNVAEGMTTKDIAAKLEVSVKTVETHRHRIMDKLGLHSVAELTRFALRHGLTDLDV